MTVLNQDVFTGTSHSASVDILTRLDGDTVIVRLNTHIVHIHVAGRVNVYTIRTGYVFQRTDICTFNLKPIGIQDMQAPGSLIDQLQAGDLTSRTIGKTNHTGTTAITKRNLFPFHTLTVYGTFTAKLDILGVIEIKESTTPRALNPFETGLDNREIFRTNGTDQSSTLFNVEVHSPWKEQCSTLVLAGRHKYRTSSVLMSLVNYFLNLLGNNTTVVLYSQFCKVIDLIAWGNGDNLAFPRSQCEDEFSLTVHYLEWNFTDASIIGVPFFHYTHLIKMGGKGGFLLAFVEKEIEIAIGHHPTGIANKIGRQGFFLRRLSTGIQATMVLLCGLQESHLCLGHGRSHLNSPSQRRFIIRIGHIGYRLRCCESAIDQHGRLAPPKEHLTSACLKFFNLLPSGGRKDIDRRNDQCIITLSTVIFQITGSYLQRFGKGVIVQVIKIALLLQQFLSECYQIIIYGIVAQPQRACGVVHGYPRSRFTQRHQVSGTIGVFVESLHTGIGHPVLILRTGHPEHKLKEVDSAHNLMVDHILGLRDSGRNVIGCKTLTKGAGLSIHMSYRRGQFREIVDGFRPDLIPDGIYPRYLYPTEVAEEIAFGSHANGHVMLIIQVGDMCQTVFFTPFGLLLEEVGSKQFRPYIPIVGFYPLFLQGELTGKEGSQIR